MDDEVPEKDEPVKGRSGSRKKIEDASKTISEKKSRIDTAITDKKQQIDSNIQKVRQPLESFQYQARSVMGKPEEKNLQLLGSLRSFAQPTLNAAFQKASQPAELLKQKQLQTEATVQAATTRVDAAKKFLEGKENAHAFAQNQANQQMNQAISATNKAKQGIEDRQREFGSAMQLVQSLRTKIESQVSSASQLQNIQGGGPGTSK